MEEEEEGGKERQESLLTSSSSSRRSTNQAKKYTRCSSHAQDELHTFRSCLTWMCVDQSTVWTATLSWSMFVLFAIIVPCVSHFFLAACPDCDSKHRRQYDVAVQLSLSGIACLSFVCLSRFFKLYGLKRFLFFDKLRDENKTVRDGYTYQLNRTQKLLSIFVLPCFSIECAYKIWWYASEPSHIPFLGNAYLSDAVACALELCSWLYRTSVFFLVCVLFRLVCHLQILRLKDFAQVFQFESDVKSILAEHLRIRRHLRIISNRYRLYILWVTIFVTGTQFASLLITTKSHAKTNVFGSGELALCSITLVTGLFILIRSAAKITHKAQAITCLAAKWHVCATVDSFDATEGETPKGHVVDIVDGIIFPSNGVVGGGGEIERSNDQDDDDVGDEEDDVDNTRINPAYAHSTISFHKRQALVTYFENNKAGITVYGFMLDRTYIHTIVGIELSLVLWLLGKTIGIT